MRTIDFKTSGYFSWTIIFFGMVLTIIGALVVLKSLIVGLIIILMCIVIFTTHYRLRVDFEKKVFRDYLWILGMKQGKEAKFEALEYLFIKKSMVTQTMHVRVASTTIRKETFDGYLKFSECDKIHLATKDSKNDLIKNLRRISHALRVKIIDYSEGTPKEI